MSKDVPVGYKLTEVGVIPDDWEVCQIRDIANVRTGPFGSALHERDYVTNGTPIITVEHLDELGVAHSNNIPMVSDKDKDRLKSYSLEINDIVFSRVGSIDRNSLIRESEAGWLFSSRLLRLRLNDKRVFSPYLSYHFHAEPFKLRVRTVAVGQTMPSLNTQILNGIDIILPPLPEQEAIALVLSDTDALITSLDKLIAKKRDIKQAAMQQLLTGKQRLEGFGDSSGKFKQTEIGLIPEDWEIFPLQMLVSRSHPITYGVLKPGDYFPEGIPLLQIQDVIHGDIKIENLHRISQQLNNQYSRTKLQGGEIVVSLVGTIGKFAHIPSCLFGANLHRNLAKISITDDRSSKFVFYCLTSEYAQKSIKLTTFGSTQALLNLADLRKLSIALPSLPEQQTIAKVLSDMDSEISALEQRRNKTKALKQAMMQELLTGRIRLL